MTRESLRSRDLSRLEPMAEDFRAAVLRVLSDMDAAGYPMMVTDGARTDERQAELFAQGRTTPGPIVTYADGVRNRSNHQLRGDGKAYAVDCAFVVAREDDPESFTVTWDGPWALYGQTAQNHGLSWGGLWHHPDNPHIEWPRGH